MGDVWFQVIEEVRLVVTVPVVRLVNILCSLVVRVGIELVIDSSTLVQLDHLLKGL